MQHKFDASLEGTFGYSRFFAIIGNVISKLQSAIEAEA